MAVGVVILMVVPNYAAMVAGRVLQGASGAGIWTLGLALGACSAGQEWMRRCSFIWAGVWPMHSRQEARGLTVRPLVKF